MCKKHFAKKCKNKSCRDGLPPKDTSPKTNETSDNAQPRIDFVRVIGGRHFFSHAIPTVLHDTSVRKYILSMPVPIKRPLY